MIPPIANRFVAGETPADALSHTRDLNNGGVKAILNLLGEHYHERPPADADADAYVDLVGHIADSDVDACISVKPSQVGINVGDGVFEENLARIADAAQDEGVFCWVDMEDHTTTDVTLDAVEEAADIHPGGVGIAIQANLKRTGEDLERFESVPAKVRLVKGAYDEPKTVAYKDKADVNAKYREYMEYLFANYDDGMVAIGSHDPQMIEYAEALHDEHGTDFEFQMLMGVRTDEQFRLAKQYEMYQYVPYGSKWFQYFYRRVMERKENLLFAARAVLGR